MKSPKSFADCEIAEANLQRSQTVSNELCWKCRDFILEHHFSKDFFDGPFHCHHEPKEKEKCWCEICFYDREIKHYPSGYVIKAKFCPECGRSLNG